MRSGTAYYPVLDPRLAVRRPRGLPAALTVPGSVRVRYARTGLRLIARALDPATTVLLPDFLCRSAVEPFAGLRTARYRVGEDLVAAPDAVATALPAGGPAAVLVVSYFGLPQPFDELRSLDALLIDDAAHSLLSEHRGQPYGTLGDAGVVGIHKTLPVPDGAVAIGSERLRLGPPDGIAAGGRAPLAYGLRTVLRNVDQVLRLDAMGRRARRVSGELPAEDGSGDGTPEALGWSRFTQRVVERIDPAAERARRRAAFEAWPELLAGATAVHAGALPEGVAPSGFPARIDDEERFARAMEELRVEWIRWPDRPHDSAAFPNGVAVLPTHTVPRRG